MIFPRHFAHGLCFAGASCDCGGRVMLTAGKWTCFLCGAAEPSCDEPFDAPSGRRASCVLPATHDCDHESKYGLQAPRPVRLC